MKPRPFGYAAVDSVEEAVALLAEHGDDAKVLAGGQSLVPLLNLRLASPAVLIDVRRVDALREATRQHDGASIGAAVVHAAVEDGRVEDPTHGLLPAVAAGIGYRAVRNVGTIGGSLAHADPSAEWPVVLSALDANAVTRSPRGERRVPVRALTTGYFSTVLEPDELLLRIDVPPTRAQRWGFTKIARKTGEFAESLAVALVTLETDGRIAGAELWLGGAAGVPVRLATAADLLRGQAWDDKARREVRAAVALDLDPPVDADGRYRVHLHGVAVCRALDDAIGGQGAL